jgi:hypothetical protein
MKFNASETAAEIARNGRMEAAMLVELWSEAVGVCHEAHARITGLCVAHNTASLLALVERIEAEHVGQERRQLAEQG